jgi:hypothetical protein
LPPLGVEQIHNIAPVAKQARAGTGCCPRRQDTIALGRLQTLLLGWNALGDNGAVAIADALLQNCTIHTLEMPWNKARRIRWRVVVLCYRWVLLRLRVRFGPLTPDDCPQS